MTDALRIAEQRLRSQGPSQARVADALHILNEWYQEEQDGYRNRHNGADGTSGMARAEWQPGEGDAVVSGGLRLQAGDVLQAERAGATGLGGVCERGERGDQL